MGSQTAHGFPYPVGTDRVMDGDNAMQALAQYTDDLTWGGLGKLPRCKITQASWSAPNNLTSQVSFVGGAVAYDTDGMSSWPHSGQVWPKAVPRFIWWWSRRWAFRDVALAPM